MPRPTYAELAAALRSAGERLAKLDEQAVVPPDHVQLYVSFGYARTDAEKTVDAAAVDAIAEALEFIPTTNITGRGARRTADRVAKGDHGRGLYVNVRATVPVPPTRAQTRAALEAENAKLRVDLAAAKGGRS